MNLEAPILLIGPLPNVPANKIGGARVSFSYLVNYLKKHQVNFKLVNTKTFELGWKKIINPVYLFFQILSKIRQSEIVFLNVSQGGTQTLGPILFFLCRLMNKKFVFRPFGGSLKDYYQKYAQPQKWLFDRTIRRADIFYLQTKEMIQYFSGSTDNILHLPTSRDAPPEALIKREKIFNKRFVFMGHVKESKGIDQILEAITALDDSYTVDIYGPIKGEKYKSLFRGKDTPYKGLLKKEDVLSRLSQYDVLLLPTFFSGEGYPGAIIEAYSLGLPVIATDWKAIPEIVVPDKTGFLVAPKSTTELVKAIQFFSVENYAQFSINSRNYFLESFHSDAVLSKVLDQIDQLNKSQV